MTPRKGLAAVLALVGCVLASSAQAQNLDENCTASIMNRTVQVRANGTFAIPDVPVDQGQYRVRITCKQPDGTTRTFLSPFQVLVGNGQNEVGRLLLGESQVIPLQIDVVAFKTSLGTRGETVQLSVRGTLPNGTPRDLTSAAGGTSYTTSNPLFATVSPNGLVTALARGQVIVSARNEGVLGSIVLNITIPADADGDGMTDEFERANGLNPANASDAAVDTDSDGLTNLDESRLGSNPRAADTDGDGVSDSLEVTRSTGLLSSDSNRDGLSDGQESQRGTNPLNADTDTDRIPDGLEVQLSLNPLVMDAVTRVEGRVVDSGGAPVNGATALVFGLFTGTTDATGTFELADVPATLGDISALARIIRNGQVLEGVSAPVPPAADGITDVGTIQLGLNSGTLSGLITSPQNQPVSGVQITVVSGGDRRTTTTDVTGRYRVTNLQGGPLTVAAVDPRTGLRGRGTGALPLNGSTAVDVRLGAFGTVRGTVFQRDGVTPVPAGITVTMSGGAHLNTTTNPLGNYLFDFVPIATFSLEATDASGNRGRSAAVLQFTGETGIANIAFLGRGRVNVTVVGAGEGGQPVANASVNVSSLSIFGGSRNGTTDAAGRVSFFDIFVGDIKASASFQLDGTGGQASGVLEGEGDVLDLEIELSATGTVAGRVFRAASATPAIGVRVDLSNGRSTVTNSLGEYRFELVRVGDYIVNALDQATGDRGRANTTIGGQGQTGSANITLNGQAPVTVDVRDGSDVRVVGAQVTVQGTGTFGGTFQGVTGEDGTVTFPRVFVGPYNVTASNPLTQLGGSATGTAVLNQTTTTEVHLQAAGTINGTVLSASGTPVSNLAVRLVGPVFRLINNPANGQFSFPQVPVGTYTLQAVNAAGRIRGFSTNVIVGVQGDVITRNITLIGLGTVTGLVTNPDGSVAPGTPVTLTSNAPTVGGQSQTFADVTGRYTLGDVPIGPFTVVAQRTVGNQQYFGTAQGEVASDGQTVPADIALSANLIPSTTTLFDANNFEYNLRENASIQDGTRGFFGGDFASNRGGLLLDIVANGTPTRFVGSGFGTSEESGREIAIAQNGVAGLNITRKVFVPRQGYFARYLELLQNPTGAPITVDVRLTSHSRFLRKVQNGFAFDREPRIVSTSNGDINLDLTPGNPDRWLVLDDDEDLDPFTINNIPAVAHVFDGANADASESAEFTLTVPSYGRLVQEWRSITIPAGGTVALMHFVSQEISRLGAQAAAERLVQLPPEAIDGLDPAERAAVRNFTVPADGVSTIAPLPLLNGSLTGRVLASDSSTLGGALVTYRSPHPLFGRTHQFFSNGLGEYRLDARFVDGNSVPVPVIFDTPAPGDENGLVLRARHPLTLAWSPDTNGIFGEGLINANTDIEFTNTGVLSGTVRRFNGAVVTNGSIQVSGGQLGLDGLAAVVNVPVGQDGSYNISGLPASTYSLLATVPHPQGTALTSGVGAPVVNDQIRTADIAIGATGGVTGFVRRVDLTPAVNVTVQLRGGGLTRSTRTDTGGRYTLTDVYAGPATLESVDSASNTAASADVTIPPEAVVNQDLTLMVGGVVEGTVRIGTTPVVGAQVTVEHGEDEDTVTTDGSGRYRLTGVTPGVITVRALGSNGFRGFNTGTLGLSGSTLFLDVNLFAGGTVTGIIRRAVTNAPAGPGIQVSINRFVPGLPSQVLTDATGRYTFESVAIGTFNLDVTDPATGDRGRATNQLNANGEVRNVDVTLNGIGSVIVTVQDAGGTLVPGAQVTLQSTTSFGGSQNANTGAGGTVTFQRVLAGSFSVYAVDPATGLGGNASGNVGVGATVPITVNLQPAAVILGRVFQTNSTTPVPGVAVRLFSGTFGFLRQVTTATDGSYRFDAVPLGSYIVDVIDGGGRVRARQTGIGLETNGEIETRNLTFVGLGSVVGVVRNPNSSLAVGLGVSVRSGNAEVGGFFNATTDSDGSYRVTGVPIGSFVATATSAGPPPTIGETSGQITMEGQEVTANIQLVANAITLPVNRFDVNDFYWNPQPDGSINDGTNSVFRGDHSSNVRAFLLDITASIGTTRFVGGAIPTTEESGQEIVVQQNGLAGLNVTRKVYTPRDGYFTRFLEILRNPTMDPITVGVRTTSHFRTFNGIPQVRTTSNGNLALETGEDDPDRWLVIDDNLDVDPFVSGSTAAVALVFDGENAAASTDSATFANPTGSWGRFTQEWSTVTIAPGGTATLMHFGVQQTSRAAAQASAARLVQLPPEALAGLSAEEIATIQNFAVPAGGASELDPFVINGAVNGGLFEFNGTTSVGQSAAVRFRSNNPIFGRTRSINTNSLNAFNLQPVIASLGASGSIAVPREPFTITATHPNSQVVQQVIGTFGPGQTTVTQNVVFTNTGVVTGTVRRSDGTSVGSGNVTLFKSNPSVSAFTSFTTGTFQLGGLPGAVYNYQVNVAHPQGATLQFTGTTTVAAGQFNAFDLTLPATGNVTGVLRNGAGVPFPSQQVRLRDVNTNRLWTTSTNGSGQFTFTDIPVGTNFRLHAFEPNTSIEAFVIISVAANQTTTQDLTLVAMGTLQVTVNFASGSPAQGSQVYVLETGRTSYRFLGSSDSAGRVTAPVTVGPFTVRAHHPNDTSLFTLLPGNLPGVGETLTVTAVLPGTGVISGRVTHPNGASGQSVFVQLINDTFGGAIRSATTDSNGNYTMTLAPVNASLRVRAQSPVGNSSYRDVPVTLATDGQSETVNVTLPAQATVRVTVLRSNGDPFPSAQIELRTAFRTFFEFWGQTNAQGMLDLPNVPEGAFTVRARDPNTGAFSGSASGEVTLADHGNVIPITIDAPDLVDVEGFVYAGDGETPISGAEVDFYDEETGNFLTYTYTDEDGSYEVQGLVLGSQGVRIIAYAPDYSVAVETSSDVQNPPGTIHLDITIPISVVKGQVTHNNGDPVEFPNVFARQDDGSGEGDRYYYTNRYDEEGNYLILGVRPGPFTLFAQDGESGIGVEVASEVISVGEAVVVDVTLPEVVGIGGYVRRPGQDGEPGETVPYAQVALFGNEALGFDRFTQADEDGWFQFDNVPLGNVSAQACEFTDIASFAALAVEFDDGPCGVNSYVLDEPNTFIESDIVLADVGTVRGVVYQGDFLTPVPNATVRVDNFTHAGPLRAPQSSATTTDEDGEYEFTNVPWGVVTVVAFDGEENVGLGEGSVGVGEIAEIDIQMNNALQVFGSIAFGTTNDFRYDMQCDGSLAEGGMFNGPLSDAYDGAYILRIGDTYFPCVGLLRFEDGTELSYAQGWMEGLTVRRKVFTQPGGEFARYIEELTNYTGADIQQRVEIRVFAGGSSSGNNILVGPGETSNTYAVTGQDGDWYPVLAHVFAGLAAPVGVSSTRFIEDDNLMSYSYVVTVPAGGTVRLMHFAVQRDPSDPAGAANLAVDLRNLTHPDALNGMTDQERETVINFEVPEP